MSKLIDYASDDEKKSLKKDKKIDRIMKHAINKTFNFKNKKIKEIPDKKLKQWYSESNSDTYIDNGFNLNRYWNIQN